MLRYVCTMRGVFGWVRAGLYRQVDRWVFFKALVCWDEVGVYGCVGLICDVEICVYDAWSFWLGVRWVVPASGSMEVSFLRRVGCWVIVYRSASRYGK